MARTNPYRLSDDDKAKKIAEESRREAFAAAGMDVPNEPPPEDPGDLDTWIAEQARDAETSINAPAALTPQQPKPMFESGGPEFDMWLERQAQGGRENIAATPEQPVGDWDSPWKWVDAIASGLAGKDFDADYWSGAKELERKDRLARQNAADDRSDRYLALQEQGFADRRAREQGEAARQAAAQDPDSPASAAARTKWAEATGRPEEAFAGWSAADFAGKSPLDVMMEIEKRNTPKPLTALDQARIDSLRARAAKDQALAKKAGRRGGGGYAAPPEADAELDGMAKAVADNYSQSMANQLLREAQMGGKRGEQARKELRSYAARAAEKGEQKAQAYRKDADVLLGINQSARIIDDIIEKGDDIPGVGVYDSRKPNFMTSEDGLKLRAALDSMMEDFGRVQSGGAITAEELSNFNKLIAGASAANTEKEFRTYYQQFVDKLRGKLRAMEVGREGQAESVKEAFYGGEQGAAPAKIVLPNGGTAPDTPENRAKLDKAGIKYEVSGG